MTETICFSSDNMSIRVFDTKETIMTKEEYQNKYFRLSFDNRSLNKCVLCTSLEEYENKKKERILRSDYNQFISKKINDEWDKRKIQIDPWVPCNVYADIMEEIEQEVKRQFPFHQFKEEQEKQT